MPDRAHRSPCTRDASAKLAPAFTLRAQHTDLALVPRPARSVMRLSWAFKNERFCYTSPRLPKMQLAGLLAMCNIATTFLKQGCRHGTHLRLLPRFHRRA